MNQRFLHYLLLSLLAGVLFFVNLGGPSLWDIDEGNNATCAREMLETGNYIVPRFNYDLRVDKPALLYWLQVACYQTFGVHEFSARLPSALAAWLTILVLYELARSMFGANAGLFAGIILASSIMFSGAAHFANPDALLTLWLTATFYVFWVFHARGRADWLIWAGATSGLAVLTKGPIGIVMPCGVIGLYLLWSRQWRILLDRRLALGTFLFLLVCLPWYILVAAETRGAYLRGFLGTHNVGRFLSPMEGHGGSAGYYLLVFAIGAAPWSAFFGLAGWHAWRVLRGPKTPQAGPDQDRYRFLLSWIGLYVVFFTISRTKLPNYVLPAYPAVVLLAAHTLELWRRGEIVPPRWLMHATLVTFGVTGLIAMVGLLAMGGAFPITSLRTRAIPGLASWSTLGAILILGAAMAWRCLARDRRDAVLACTLASAALFVGCLAGLATQCVNAQKPPQSLVREFGFEPNERMIQVGTFRYFQPSLVFYCKRQVWNMTDERCVHDMLRSPFPAYLFVPEAVWNDLEHRLGSPGRLLGKHRDIYSGKEIVLITNQ